MALEGDLEADLEEVRRDVDAWDDGPLRLVSYLEGKLEDRLRVILKACVMLDAR